MDILLDVPAVQSLSEVGALRRFYDKVESQSKGTWPDFRFVWQPINTSADEETASRVSPHA